ncbi:MAG: hypothetical protein QGG22_02340 [Candidatus Thalassarchaeaceae archaeon]|jgi:hypothetical protein|nr:hypothetical protein [Candidatus Thalassarchaeaceae archaeon]|tara:strand:- start:905 stop:1531 length:627 start_codon:yes stop_codon:yes gene_type:complete
MGEYIPPSAFYTFDPIRYDPILLIEPILSSIGGDHKEIKKIVQYSNEIKNLVEGKEAPYDHSTMLFLTIMDWKEGGGSPEPLDNGIARDRIGRFPSDSGNAIEYILEFTRENEEEILFHELLIKLTNGLSPENLGEEGFNRGFAGMELLGWLNNEDVKLLLQTMQSGKWVIKSNETIDGGVRDSLRHLQTLLKAANRRGCGILMRRHH